jgi:hypothetical protein
MFLYKKLDWKTFQVFDTGDFLPTAGSLKWEHAEKTLKIYSLPVPTEIPAVYGTEKCIPVPRIAH